AGLVAADHLFELDAPIFEKACELEGHPDNVAAALRGGFVICTEAGADRFEPPPGIEGVIAIPPDPVPTEKARAALPDEVPMADAVHNVGHAALLVLGLQRNDLDLVARGLADRLHQPYRSPLFPASMELLERARDFGAIGASISGAGPTVLFWTQVEATGAVIGALERETDGWADVRRAPFERQGADVREL
ncbi:MAG: homoserine kinase, partial [Solirubrobacteraceae bacterium]